MMALSGYPKYQVPYCNRDPKRDHKFDTHIAGPTVSKGATNMAIGFQGALDAVTEVEPLAPWTLPHIMDNSKWLLTIILYSPLQCGTYLEVDTDFHLEGQ